MVADHVLKNTQTTLEITFTAGAATGTVTYAVTDANGDAVASGNATHGTGGAYSFVLAPQDTVKSLTIVWTGTWQAVSQSITTYAEIVGGHLFTIAEARAFDGAALASDTVYTDAAIREARAGIADFFEDCTGVSFIPRYRQDTLDAPGTPDLWLTRKQVRSLIACSTNGTALTTDELAAVKVYEYGKLYRPTGAWPYTGWPGAWSWQSRQSIVVEYEHGYQAVPWEIHQAALTYLRYVLVSSDISDRAISVTNDMGQFQRLSIPSMRYPTGIPIVDAALNRKTPQMVLA